MRQLTTAQIQAITHKRNWALDAAIGEINALQNLVEATPETLVMNRDQAQLKQTQAAAAWQDYIDTVFQITGFDALAEIGAVDKGE